MSTAPPQSTALGAKLPIAVAVVNDYELIVDGVGGMLARFPDRAAVVDRIVIGEPIDHPPVDVALYDTYGRRGIAGQALKELREHRDVLHTAMFSLDLAPELVDEGRASGTDGFIAKSLPAEAIVDALVRIASGEEVVAQGASTNPVLDELDWPGKEEGLTARESEVLVLASEGLNNAEIGTALYLGKETVKTHLSRAFTKLRVRNRAEAVRFVFGTGAFERYRPAAETLDEA